MSDGANDALRSYIRAGMPLDRTVGKACPHCGRWSYTRNKCHPKQNLFCAGVSSMTLPIEYSTTAKEVAS